MTKSCIVSLCANANAMPITVARPRVGRDLIDRPGWRKDTARTVAVGGVLGKKEERSTHSLHTVCRSMPRGCKGLGCYYDPAHAAHCVACDGSGSWSPVQVEGVTIRCLQ